MMHRVSSQDNKTINQVTLDSHLLEVFRSHLSHCKDFLHTVPLSSTLLDLWTGEQYVVFTFAHRYRTRTEAEMIG